MSDHKHKEQLTTFVIDGDLFGVEVTKVQEVTGQLSIHRVPLAPSFVLGLINLRGQIATALSLRSVFKKKEFVNGEQMSVVCKIDGNLMSMMVDSIGDVLEVESNNFESTPETISKDIRHFIKGVYKINNSLLSVLDLETLAKELSPTHDTSGVIVN